jgi:hypothetical protein
MGSPLGGTQKRLYCTDQNCFGQKKICNKMRNLPVN